MNILLINGSPKGERSNTLKLANAFIDGIRSLENHPVDTITVTQKNIGPCRGCFGCWEKTPGKCVIEDDMGGILEKYMKAGLIVWSFPLYYYSVPGILKNLIDRQLPLFLPFMGGRSDGMGSGSHPPRYDLSGQRHVLISTCGFYSAEGNYDGVLNLFDHIYGRDNYKGIFCGQGELFRVRELQSRTGAYLELVRQAGSEYARGSVAPETEAALKELLYPRETFEEMADASWNIRNCARIKCPAFYSDCLHNKEITCPNGHVISAQILGENGREQEALRFTRQMAALHRPKSGNGKEIILEFHYTDVDETYQILLNAEGHRVLTGTFAPYTTRIETPLKVWQDIAQGKLSGQEALMQHKYRVLGDFDLMLHWDDYFAETGEKPRRAVQGGREKKTSMIILLAPWIVTWTALPIHSLWGGAAGIIAAAVMPLLYLACKPVVFEYISISAVSCISLAALLGADTRMIVPLSYGLFGLMWFISTFLKIPLTAWYSQNAYGGEQALSNPLFMQTNRILTACWGILYLLTPVWTWILMGTGISFLTGALNSLLPALLGIFTRWFQKWYPPRFARAQHF
ncbi:MAG: NAD(P)H-dependent oxidoreductase [Treponema sp.]|jgi:multimeric flavodoxin WrbA|nr:NAD(P)H-dependent oxidoreductase [Treponema sp.]